MSYAIAHLLPNRAAVYRLTRALQNSAVIESEAAVATGVPCRVTSPRSRSLEVYAGAETPRLTAVAYFEPTADVITNDRIEVLGRSYRVLSAEAQSDGVYLHASLDPLA